MLKCLKHADTACFILGVNDQKKNTVSPKGGAWMYGHSYVVKKSLNKLTLSNECFFYFTKTCFNEEKDAHIKMP